MRSPEKDLWQSVLFTALLDTQASIPNFREWKKPNGKITDNGASIREAERAKSQAKSWISGGNRDFREVCENAGFDPDAVSEAWAAGKISIDTLKRRYDVMEAA